MVVRCVWSVFRSLGLETQPHNGNEELGSLPPPKLFDITSSASTVNYAVRVCVLTPMLMGPPPFKKKREPEVNVRGGGCTRRPWMSRVAPGRPLVNQQVFAVGFPRRCPSAVMSARTPLHLTVGPCVGGLARACGGTRQAQLVISWCDPW